LKSYADRRCRCDPRSERKTGMREDDAGNFGEFLAGAGLEGVAAGVKEHVDMLTMRPRAESRVCKMESTG